MSTIEKLFVQIFERKKWIIEQLNHQKKLYDQHLASKLLIQGIPPPSWLLNADFSSSTSSDLNGLNKQELISELLLPRSQPLQSSGPLCLYNKSATTAANAELPDALFAGPPAVDKKGSTVPPQRHVDGADSTISHVATTPYDHTDAQMTDIYTNQSLARIQRSRSRQKALELRNSAKVSAKSHLRKENNPGFCSSDTACRIYGGKPNSISDILESVKPSAVSIENPAMNEMEPGDCVGKKRTADVSNISIMRSGCQVVAEGETGNYRSKRKSNVCSKKLIKSGSVCQQSNVGDYQSCENSNEHYDESTRSKTIEATQAEKEYDRSREKIEDFNSGRITRSRNALAQAGNGDHNNHITGGEGHNSRTTRSTSHESKQAETSDHRSRQKIDNSFTSSSTKSVTFCSHDEPMKPISFSNMAGENGHALSKFTDRTSSLKTQMLAVGATDLQNHLAAQVTARDSEACQNDAKVNTENLREVSAKIEVSEQHVDQITQSRSTHSSQDISRPENSSNGLVERGTWSKSIASCNPSLGRSSEEVKHHTISTIQVAEVDTLNCTQMCGAVAAVRTELASSNLDEARPIDSGSNLQDAVLRVGLDVLVRSPLLNSGMLVKPKQLDFDDAEESCPDEVPDSVQKTGGHAKLEGSSVLWSGMSTGKLPSNGYRGKSDSVLKESSQEQQDVSRREGEASTFYIENKWGDLSARNGVHLAKGKFNSDTSHAFSSSRTSEMFAPSLARDEHLVAVDEVDHALPDSPRISVFNSSCLPVVQEDLQGRGEAVDPCFSDSQMNGQIVLPTQELVHELDGGWNTVEEAAVPSLPKVEAKLGLNLSFKMLSDHFEAEQSTSASSEEIKLGCSSCSDCKVQTDPDISEVVQFMSCRKPKELAGVPALDSTPAISGNETNCKSAVQEIEVDTFITNNVEPCPDHISIDTKFADCYKVMEAQPIEKSMLPEYSINSAVGGSWPLYKRRKIESSTLGPRSASPSLKDEVSFKGRRRIMIPSKFEDKHLKQSNVLSLTEKMTIESQNWYFEEGNMNRSSGVLDMDSQDDLLHIEDKAIASVTQDQTSSQVTLDPKKSLQEDVELDCSVVSPQMEYMDVVGSDQNIPVFEGFIIDRERENAELAGDVTALDDIDLPKNTIERASFLEQLCKSATLSTPLSHFSTAYKSHRAPTMYHSLPNRLIEHIDLKSTLSLNGSADQQVKATYLSMKDDTSCSLPGKSYSDCLALPIPQFCWDFRKPYLSPVGKGFECIPSKSCGSDKHGSSNPELTCFPIEEDPESSDGNISANDISDTCEEDNSSSARNNSVKGEPLCDVTVKHNSNLASYHATERGSLESLAAKTGDSEMHNMASQKTGKPSSRSRHTSQGKENQNFSLGHSSIKKRFETLNSRLNKPKLSGKASLRSGGRSVLEKECKQNNIVSNVKSFLPLVKQKQVAAIAPVKRDVKVKALEAAEAAKRLAEKREIERKQKKEALKLERARLEQENLRLIELQKKLKEEERKKKDADIAARKRQREEEERKEKERKRKRVGEARKQQRSQEEKVLEKIKECRVGASIDETHDSEGSNEEKQKHAAGEEEVKNSQQSVNERSIAAEVSHSGAGVVSINDHKDSTSFCGIEKVQGNVIVGSSTPNQEQNKNTNSMTDPEQSYEISPYQCSDDEEEEEDEVRNKKFIPTWASKSRIAQALSVLPRYDPDAIFPLGSFCSLDEVLLPRKLQQKFSAE